MKCSNDQSEMIEVDMSGDMLMLTKKKIAFMDLKNGEIPFKVYACHKCGKLEFKIDPKDIDDQVERKEN